MVRRERASLVSSRFTRAFIGGGGLLAVALSVVSIVMMNRHQAARDRANAMLHTRNQELAIATEQALSSDRLKSAFLATMSHELRTPLNSIIGFTGIILQRLAGPLDDEQAKQLGMVRASARHLLTLINDVLDISKIEAGPLEVMHTPYDLHVSIGKVVDLWPRTAIGS